MSIKRDADLNELNLSPREQFVEKLAISDDPLINQGVNTLIMSYLADIVDQYRDSYKAGSSDPKTSYIASLFFKGDDAILKKIVEEVADIVITAKEVRSSNLTAEQQKLLIGEMADLWFHCLIALSQYSLRPEDVIAEMADLIGVQEESKALSEDLIRRLDALTPSNTIESWSSNDLLQNGNINPPLQTIELESGEVNVSALTRLKMHTASRLYLEHLKKYSSIRWLVNLLWRRCYPIYARYILSITSEKRKSWKPLIRLADYIKAENIPSFKVFDATRVDTPAPEVIPIEDQIFFTSPHGHYDFPPIYVAEVSGAEIYGGTNLVFVKDAAICHDLYNFANDYTSEELHGRHLIDYKKKRILLLLPDSMPHQMPMAAVFLDACSSNYAHWLTEVLPRIATFCSIDQYAHIPIIIDSGLHPNIMESLALVVGYKRQIICLPKGCAIKVATLFVTSVTGYVPFERRAGRLAEHSHGLFSPLAFDLLKKVLLSHVREESKEIYPKKIYLRRTSGGRKIINSHSVEATLFEKGYFPVEMEKLTFLEQLSLFSGLEEIVAPSGAAVANEIFLPSTARMHILIPRCIGTSYWYWQNIACACGNKVLYSLGVPNNIRLGIHSDFAINSKVFNYER